MNHVEKYKIGLEETLSTSLTWPTFFSIISWNPQSSAKKEKQLGFSFSE